MTILDEIRAECAARAKRRAIAMQFTVHMPLALDRPPPPVRAAEPGDRRPLARSRNPCPRCGTRGDLGCAHFRPVETAACAEPTNMHCDDANMHSHSASLHETTPAPPRYTPAPVVADASPVGNPAGPGLPVAQASGGASNLRRAAD